mgnify:CR=1 FL=1
MRRAALVLAILLAGCGNDQPKELRLARGIAASITGGRDARPAPVPEGAPLSAALGLTRAQIAAIGRPVLFAELRPQGRVAGLVADAGGADGTRWITQDGIALTERDGLVIATRGLPGDLMSADVAEIAAALRAGGAARAARVHRYLDDSNRIVTRAWRCRIVPEGREEVTLPGGRQQLRRFRERCVGAQVAFDNFYWMSDGRVWQSIQHLGPGERVVRMQLFAN